MKKGVILENAFQKFHENGILNLFYKILVNLRRLINIKSWDLIIDWKDQINTIS